MTTNSIYKAEALVYGAKYELTINGIPFATGLTGRPINAEIPVNEFLISPKSVFGITLYPMIEGEELLPNAEVSLIIKRYEHSANQDMFTEVVRHIKEPGSLVEKPDYKFSEEFNVVSSYPNPKWYDNLKIDKFDKVSIGRLQTFFKDLWDLFKAKDIAKIANLFSQKFADYETCYNLPRGNRQEALLISLREVFEDSNFELVNFSLSVFKINIIGSNKIANLLDEDGNSYIMYYNYAESILIQFPISIGINNNQEVYVCQ